MRIALGWLDHSEFPSGQSECARRMIHVRAAYNALFREESAGQPTENVLFVQSSVRDNGAINGMHAACYNCAHSLGHISQIFRARRGARWTRLNLARCE